jgi:hypothetical protein
METEVGITERICEGDRITGAIKLMYAFWFLISFEIPRIGIRISTSMKSTSTEMSWSSTNSLHGVKLLMKLNRRRIKKVPSMLQSDPNST